MHKYTSWTIKIQKQGPYGTNKWNKFGHHIQFKQHITTPTAIYIHMTICIETVPCWTTYFAVNNMFQPHSFWGPSLVQLQYCCLCAHKTSYHISSYIDLVYLFCLNCTCLLEVSNFTVLWNLLAQQRAMLLERAGGGMSFFRQRYRLMAWGGRVGRNNVQAPMFDVTLWPPHLNLHVQSSYI